MIWIALVIVAVLAILLWTDYRLHAGAVKHHGLVVCPLCSREIHNDWLTSRGYCCDCDCDLNAIGRTEQRLSALNPDIIQRPKPLLTPVSPERKLSSLPSSTSAAACADRRAAPGYYVW